jgi:DNA-binding transcriptional regulator/RsmH inhibitor MraZ
MRVVDADVDVRPRNRVATYRAYRIDDAGRVTEAASVFEAPDDATALARARALMGNRGRFEIWERSRLVGLIKLNPRNIEDCR